MNCPNCQATNPEGAKFCMSCGHSLALTCPNCQTELPAKAAFCYNCGHQIGKPIEAPAEPASTSETRLERYIPKELLSKLKDARESQAMAGERRIVTMLFCDVGGSTAAAAQLDPEEWTEIINGAFEHLITPVYRYEGTVARLMGDGILAFFGAPIAHEDDPQRAVLAGLEIIKSIKSYSVQVSKSWGLDLNVRVGINTGLVVVGAVGSDMRMEYTALGDAINIAARMEQAAEPGTVQIAEATHKLIAPLFEFEDLGGLAVKGKENPVQAYRVIGSKTAPGRLRGIEGLEAPLTGRDHEFRTLRDAVVELRGGRGQIRSLIAEAGLGKSRMIAELGESVRADEEDGPKVRWIEGYSLSYESATPYAPFMVLFKHCFGIEENETDWEKYERISDQIERIMPGRASEIAPFLATLLQIELPDGPLQRVKYLEPPQLRQAVFQATTDFISALAAAGPLVLVFDDLHWIDPTSLELLQQLLPITDRYMLMIIALFRPRRQERSWKFHQIAEMEYAHRYTEMHLKPLDDESSRQLVANLLHVEGLPDKVRNLILTKAEGNPFYVEEVIRSLLDARLVVRDNGTWRATEDIADIAVPDTLSAVITTRLDRLEDETRRVAQTAAVIGREFQYDTLAALLGKNGDLDGFLTDLQRRGLIVEASRIPSRRFIFKHALTRETAYQSLLLRTRRDLHRQLGSLLEKLEPDRAFDIARNYLEARERGRALPHLVEAGDRSAQSYSTPEAIGYYEQALQILEELDEPALTRRAYEGLGNALTFANEIPRALETFEAMLARAEDRADVPMQVSALNKISFVSGLRMGAFQKAEEYLTISDRLARENEDKSGLSELSMIRCMMCSAVADFDGVVRHMDEMIAIAKDLGVEEQMSMGLAHIASSQMSMLNFDEGWETLQDGLALSRKIGDLEHVAQNLALAAPIYLLRNGEFEAARQSARDGLEIAERIGGATALTQGLRSLGIIAHLQGDYEEALGCYKRYLAASRKAGMPWCEAEALCRLGSTYLDISPALVDRMLDFHAEALKVLEQPGAIMFGGSSWAELGFCAHTLGKTEDASTLFEKGLTTPTITMNIEKPRNLVGMAKVALAKGNAQEAAGLVEEARAIAEKHAMKNYFALIEMVAAEVAAAQGENDQALTHYERAEQFARDLGMRPHAWHAAAAMAQLLAEQGRSEDAETKRLEARGRIDEITELFRSDDLRTHYLEHALKQLNGGK